MSLIEGVGDEVAVFVTVVFILVLLGLAWLSTYVADQPLMRVIVLDRPGFQRLLQIIRNGRLMAFRAVRVTVQGTATQSDHTQSDRVPDVPHEDPAQSPADDTSPDVMQTPHEERQGSTGGADDDDVARTESVTPSSLSSSENRSTNSICSNGSYENSEKTSDKLDKETSPSVVREEPQPQAANEEAPSVVGGSSESDAKGSSQTATDVTIGEPEIAPSRESETSSPAENQSETERQSGHIRIRLKYFDDRQRLVQAKPEDTVGDFKRSNFMTELAQDFGVRLIFRGHELRQDRNTLRSYNLEDESVVHCLLNRVTQDAGAAQRPQPADLDIGHLMFPLFALMLALIWYCRFTYKSYFNTMSTFALIGITFLFVIAAMAGWRSGGELHEHED